VPPRGGDRPGVDTASLRTDEQVDMSPERSRVLVTGATGFVGSSLARRFASQHDLHLVARPGSSLATVSDLVDRAAVHRCDLTDARDTDRLVRAVAPQVVVHAAAYGTRPGQDDVPQMARVNVLGTMNVVEACRGLSMKSIVATGSYVEYGAKSHAMHEGDRLEPVSEYGVTKAAATLYCREAAQRLGLPITVLRLFTAYGPHEPGHRLVPTIIKAALAAERPRLSSPGSVRDWIFIDDIADAVLRIVERPQPGSVLNVASGVEASVGDVVQALRTLVPGAPEPIYGLEEPRSYEVPRCRGDSSALHRATGWAPRHSLLEGLTRSLAWWRASAGR
jgi:nucleoside-diphosphate-sugar epimerase